MKFHSFQPVVSRDVTDSESDVIRHFFQNPKSDGYLKSDRVGFEVFVSVQLYNYCGCYSKISLNDSTLIDGEIYCCVFFTF